MKHVLINKAIYIIIAGVLLGSILIPSNLAEDPDQDTTALTRVREGGTPYNPNQLLVPHMIQTEAQKDMPTSGIIASPPEYSPTQGVLFCFTSSYQSTVVRDMVVALTEDDQYDEIAYVWVSSSSQQSIATSMFSTGGANMSKVEFIIGPMDSIWIRDYGPHFIWQNDTLAIVDSHYYPTRSQDNFVPTLLGDEYYDIPTYDIGLYYSGGNFQPGPNRSGFCTELMNTDNPASEGFSEEFIAELFRNYQGIDTLHVMPQLPYTVDGTGHVDMWMNIVDQDTVIISRFKPGSNPTAIEITENAVPYMEALGFEVYRTPAWNSGSVHYTYTNAFRVNDRYFVPYYDSGNPSYSDEDDEAFANFSAAAGPGVEIIPIDCYDIIPAAGAIHCIVMQVPRYIDPIPSAHILWPDGGEILVAGTTQMIQWEVTDTYNAMADHIDLYYTTDNGASYTFIDTTTDGGLYEWIVTDLYSNQARIKIVATAVDADQCEAISSEVFTIAPGTQTVYDFSSGAGIDKFGWGYQTSTWNANVDGVQHPVSSEIDTLVTNAYTKLAHSDATGGDSDSNRYISPDPAGYAESTHIFEVTINEDPSDIGALDFLWEGYADSCTQIELYLWDYLADQWGDGTGLTGQNRFMDNWAGNIDALLTKQLCSDIDHYIDENGILTVLLYTERPSYQSFHDYMAITVSMIETYPTLMVDPLSHDFHAMYPNETDATVFDIWNGGAGMLNYTLSESCEWVSVSPTEGSSMGEHDNITVTVDTTDLPYGSYHCDIAITSGWGNTTFGIDVDVVAPGTPIIDVEQTAYDRGFPIRHAIDGDWGAAQSFIPTLDIITNAEVYLRKFGTPEFDLTVELRENHPQGTLIDTLVFTPAEVGEAFSWFSLDFADTAVTPGTTYFIVCPPAPPGGTTSFGYEWGYAFGNQYDDGAFWFTRNSGALWRDLPTMYEFSFRTYGYN